MAEGCEERDAADDKIDQGVQWIRERPEGSDGGPVAGGIECYVKEAAGDNEA